MIHNPITFVKDWKNKYVFIKIEGLKRSWNFDYVVLALKLKTVAKNYKAEIRRIEALGIVSATSELLSNESMDRAGVFDHGR